MNTIPLWAQLFIAVLSGGMFGAVAGVISSSIAAQQKFKELDFAYRQKLNDNLLQNARQFIDTLYIPINKSLSTLEDKYEDFKEFDKNIQALKEIQRLQGSNYFLSDQTALEIDNRARELTKNAASDFQLACLEHINLMNEVFEQGKDVYLTIEFEERLRAFDRFLYGVARLVKGGVKILSKKERVGIFDTPSIGTPQFEERFFRDVRYLKSYIKEITLGTTEVRKNKS